MGSTVSDIRFSSSGFVLNPSLSHQVNLTATALSFNCLEGIWRASTEWERLYASHGRPQISKTQNSTLAVGNMTFVLSRLYLHEKNQTRFVQLLSHKLSLLRKWTGL